MSAIDHHKFQVKTIVPWVFLYVLGSVMVTVAFVLFMLGL